PRRASALRRMLVSSDKLSSDPMNVIDWVNMFALAVNEENVLRWKYCQRRVRHRSCGTGLLRPFY
ncbi:L-serine dehydratase 1, partial [Salmonella enterica subsp. enterica serovar Montevideo str. S5-403]